MADQFSFDKKTLVDEGYTFRSWRFSLRELVLVLVAAGLLVACLFLAGFLGKSSTELQQAQTGALAASRACKGSSCLQTSAHIMELLNTSVDPCDNFFNFACGSYKASNPVDDYTLYQSIYYQMYQENQNQLLAILNSPTKTYMERSAEKKLKDFYTSCMDDFRREQLKGKPLFQYVFPPLGGWYVINTSWTQTSWDLNNAVKVVQTDLWVDAFFAPRPRPDDKASKHRIIWIYPGGAGRYMRWTDYTENPSPRIKKRQDDYKKFMRTVAQLVARDAGLSPTDDQVASRIQVFADDAYQVEAKIAKFASSSEYKEDPHIEANRVSLSDLNQQTGGEIDWTVQMSYMFNEASVDGYTKVVVPYPTYLTNLTAMIRNLDSDSKNRILHNYLMWRVLEVFVNDLSSDYFHANRQFMVDRWGYFRLWGSEQYCFWQTQYGFDTALGALYVKARFDTKNRDKVTEITEAVKTAMEDMITSNNWMDQATKDYAIQRMKSAAYKIGFPDFMLDDSKVDDVYRLVSVNRSDFFGNLISDIKAHKREWNRLLREGEDRTQWYFSPYNTVLTVLWYWDQIAVPAGVLRFPMYEYDMPHYYSFGALGSILGHNVHHLIDEEGRHWDKGGKYLKAEEGWWTKATVKNYNTARKCVSDLYNNVTQGPYVIFNGQEGKYFNVNGTSYAFEAMAITTGIRLAYNAYQSWQQKYGQDSTSPGLPYSPQQLFFIAHAQMHCYNMDPFYEYMYASQGRVHLDVRVNLALQELPEFKEAFQCQATDNMVSPNPCPYY
ncbi:endothelin-converting enzyme homolog [Babylonia areolata]|uniref:endothelin-converting enzyme homolog n=1 Tax=Babylonia areolata TaxID=304850 RepID=UPI003FD67908